MKKILKILLVVIIASILMSSSCHKDIPPPSGVTCYKIQKTTDMNTYLMERNDTTNYDIKSGTIAANTTISYNKIAVFLSFNTEIVSEDICGVSEDSVLGYIENIKVFANYYSVNDTIVNNISDIVVLKTGINNNVLGVESLINDNIECSRNIFLFLTSPTDTNCLQSFTITYKEKNGPTYTKTTDAVYIN